MDDAFIIWPHGTDKLNDILNHLNSIHQCIQFTMETKREGHLPLLDIDIYRRPIQRLSGPQSVPQTHPYQFLPQRWVPSPPFQQTSPSPHCCIGLGTFSDRTVTKSGRFSVPNCCPNISKPDNNPSPVTFLLYAVPIFIQISRVLAWHNIKSVGLPRKKISSLLLPVKDNIGLRTPGVYRILCECGKIYTGHTGPSVDTRMKEHQRHIRLEHPDKSAVAEHSIDSGHRIHSHDASILATETRYMHRIIWEAIETVCLSKSWKPPRDLCNMTPVPAMRSNIGSTCREADVRYCVCPLPTFPLYWPLVSPSHSPSPPPPPKDSPVPSVHP
jgi:hypothetical protein